MLKFSKIRLFFGLTERQYKDTDEIKIHNLLKTTEILIKEFSMTVASLMLSGAGGVKAAHNDVQNAYDAFEVDTGEELEKTFKGVSNGDR